MKNYSSRVFSPLCFFFKHRNFHIFPGFRFHHDFEISFDLNSYLIHLPQLHKNVKIFNNLTQKLFFDFFF
jgi:hypothetical protein